ncbi:MAG: tRNA pseudouridine(55) synthase TruB [Firmicutes bacterium]|nr:tRNA pseudouridine(55) synthase TruB [Bacillota bacterium]
MDGILVLLKPPGLTSHDVVDLVRTVTGQRRVGHAGTLDPGAAGVLVLLLGQAVRLSEYLMAYSKIYRAEMTLGMSTDTQDGFGRVLFRREVPPLDRQLLQDTLTGFIGDIQQTPPAFSAVKKGGRRLYELARAGEMTSVAPRTVSIYQIQLLEISPGPFPRILFDVHCSRGTYLRTLCADIGERLGVGGHLSFLLRLASGSFDLSQAITLEEMVSLGHAAELTGRLVPMAQALAQWPTLAVSREEEEKVLKGGSLWREAKGEGSYWSTVSEAWAIGRTKGSELIKICSNTGHLLALAGVEERPGGYLFRMRKVLRGEIER